MFNILKCSIKSIGRKKLRSALTVTGIAIGVLSVIIISIIGEVGKTAINDELNSMGIGGIALRTLSEKTQKTLTENELSLVKENRNVKNATPLISKVTGIKVKGESRQAVVWGIDSNADEIVRMELLYGRLFEEGDIERGERICVVDESFARNSYKRSNIVGKKVGIFIGGKYEEFTVAGVVKTGGNILKGIMGEVVPSFLYAPYTALTKSNSNYKFSQIVAVLSENADETAAEASLISSLNQSLETADAIKAENLNSQKDKLNSVLNIVTTVLSVIGGISLIVAGLSIMTVMLVTVNERTREIGIKKSIGAKRSTIMLEFLTEALLLSLIGSIIGLLTGILIACLGCAAVGVPVAVNLQAIFAALALSVLSGTVFGVYPAVKASKLKPVDALRFE